MDGSCRSAISYGRSAAFHAAWRTTATDARSRPAHARRPTEAEDVVQEAFDRLAVGGLGDELDDVHGWLAVVVRRLCLDRIRSARPPRGPHPQLVARLGHSTHRISPSIPPIGSRSMTRSRSRSPSCSTGSPPPNAPRSCSTTCSASPTPRSARSSAARRRVPPAREPGTPLHPRAAQTRDTMTSAGPTSRTRSTGRSRNDSSRPSGGDISVLHAALDPAVVGDATLFGFGPLLTAAGRPAIAQRLLGLFGPAPEACSFPSRSNAKPA